MRFAKAPHRQSGCSSDCRDPARPLLRQARGALRQSRTQADAGRLRLHRPAAIEQLQRLGHQIDIPVHAGQANRLRSRLPVSMRPRSALRSGHLRYRRPPANQRRDDGGSLTSNRTSNPIETFLVADAMTGQEAVNSPKRSIARHRWCHSHQNGRRRARRRRAVDSPKSPVFRSTSPEPAKKSTTSSRSIRNAWPPAFSAWAMWCR